MVNRLTFALLFVIGTTLMGIGVLIALNTGFTRGNGIVAAAAIGFALALPVSWLVARRITHSLDQGHEEGIDDAL